MMALRQIKVLFQVLGICKKLPEICESASVWKLTFSHFSDMSWVGIPFLMSLTTMCGLGEQYDFAGLHLSGLGTECEVLQFLLIGHMLLTLCSVFDLEDQLSDCWGDQESCEFIPDS